MSEKKNFPSSVNFCYLYQPGELEGGTKRATEWGSNLVFESLQASLKELQPKQIEPVTYYLYDGTMRGFVREELLSPNTQLPPAHVLRNSIGSVRIPSSSTQRLS